MSNGKVWFIAEASSNFGLPLTKYLLEKGHRVAAIFSDPLTPEQQIDCHPELLSLIADLTCDASIEDTFKQTITRFGKVDIVINNAGYELEQTHQQGVEHFERSVYGTFHVLKQALPHFQDQHYGHILNFPSSAVIIDGEDAILYLAAKLAIEQLSSTLIADMEALDIRITDVQSGDLRSDGPIGAALMQIALGRVLSCGQIHPRIYYPISLAQ
jgi:NADP-dependent 3-hydroxy acid dehydrogenase YdfG